MVNFYDYKSFRGVKDIAELSPSRKQEFHQIISMAGAWELNNLEELEVRESMAMSRLEIALPLINDRATRLMMAAFPGITNPKSASTEPKGTSAESSNNLAESMRNSDVVDMLEALKDFLVAKWRPIDPATAIHYKKNIKAVVDSYTMSATVAQEECANHEISQDMCNKILAAFAQRNLLSLWSLAAGTDKREIEALVESAPGTKKNPMPPIDVGVRHMDAMERAFNHRKRSLHMVEKCSLEIIDDNSPTCDELAARRDQWFKWCGCTMRKW